MFRNKLSKITRRIFYIVFAVIISVSLWFYVEITENEMLSHVISDIEIVLINEDILRDRMLLADVVTEPLTLSFEASRADINRLVAPGAITVEVDMSAITSTGRVDLVYTPVWPTGFNPNNIMINSWSTDRIAIDVDGLAEQQIEVRANYDGGYAADDLFSEPVELDPRFITVSGPESIVSRIQYAYVPIFRENLDATFTDELEFILIDDNEEILDHEQLELLSFNHESIRVVVPIRQLKPVPLQVIRSDGSSTSDENVIVTIDPSVIRISGDPAALVNINHILLGSTIDMNSFTELSISATFPIALPSGVQPVSGETEATVHIQIIGLEIEVFSTPIVQAINVPYGYRYEILTQSVDIRLRGTADELALITPMHLRVFADISDLSAGTSRVQARVAIDGLDVNVDAVGEYHIFVRLFAEE